MALGRSASDGFRRLDVTGVTVSGAAPDIQSLAFRPILRPYTLFASMRITDAAGNVFDLNLTWQAQPKLADSAEMGTLLGATPGDRPVS